MTCERLHFPHRVIASQTEAGFLPHVDPHELYERNTIAYPMQARIKYNRTQDRNLTTRLHTMVKRVDRGDDWDHPPRLWRLWRSASQTMYLVPGVRRIVTLLYVFS